MPAWTKQINDSTAAFLLIPKRHMVRSSPFAKIMRLLHVVGARPNLMKLAPVYRALANLPKIEQVVVHTGQHYDFNMSDVLFRELEIGAPDMNLQVGSSSHAQQTAEIMMRFETVAMDYRPDLVLVYGDVNSTLATALVSTKLGMRVAHVEAGLRSFDRSMPEEINRLLTDQVADLLFTPSEEGNRNLEREGIARDKIHLVGNVMIDTLIHMLPIAQTQLPENVPPRFALVTLHRPSNVDDLDWLGSMLHNLEQISSDLTVVFPVHPRTRQKLNEIGLNGSSPILRLLEPLPYLAFLALQQRATVVITDSGGIQEEATYLGVPCLTVRENTERPVTVEMGTNTLVGRDPGRIRGEVKKIVSGQTRKGRIPPLWDGHAAERIRDVIAKLA
jgi:UDP-N-acetylglucosamine 2-epimerase (non-hydrolysing)